MPTSQMNTDQIIAWLTIEGWVPIRGGGMRHMSSLYVVDIGDTILWKGTPGGHYALGGSDVDAWDRDTVDALYRTLIGFRI